MGNIRFPRSYLDIISPSKVVIDDPCKSKALIDDTFPAKEHNYIFNNSEPFCAEFYRELTCKFQKNKYRILNMNLAFF